MYYFSTLIMNFHISRKKLEKYPLRICFEHYKGLNKYQPAITYVEERFRAHFQRSRNRAKKSREFDDAPHLYKFRPLQQPPLDSSGEEDSDGSPISTK